MSKYERSNFNLQDQDTQFINPVCQSEYFKEYKDPLQIPPSFPLVDYLPSLNPKPDLS